MLQQQFAGKAKKAFKKGGRTASLMRISTVEEQ